MGTPFVRFSTPCLPATTNMSGGLGQAGFATSTGEMWVATDGGYVVKYLQTTTGDGEDYFSEGSTAPPPVTTADGVNEAVAVVAPVGCPSGLVNAPRPPDATKL